MPISASEAVELRFGRRIERALEDDAVAYVPVPPDAADMPVDVVAIVTAANAHQAKPVTVFPAI